MREVLEVVVVVDVVEDHAADGALRSCPMSIAALELAVGVRVLVDRLVGDAAAACPSAPQSVVDEVRVDLERPGADVRGRVGEAQEGPSSSSRGRSAGRCPSGRLDDQVGQELGPAGVARGRARPKRRRARAQRRERAESRARARRPSSKHQPSCAGVHAASGMPAATQGSSTIGTGLPNSGALLPVHPDLDGLDVVVLAARRDLVKAVGGVGPGDQAEAPRLLRDPGCRTPARACSRRRCRPSRRRCRAIPGRSGSPRSRR